MNEDVKKLWVEALRSGEYVQGHAYLKTDKGFCCLGVLCDLYSKHVAPVEWHPSGGVDLDFEYEFGKTGASTYPPLFVVEWAGLETQDNGDPEVTIGDERLRLSVHNDGSGLCSGSVASKKTFAQIADAIEAQL